MRIRDVRALVTGGASGLGRATVEALLESEACVGALDLPGRTVDIASASERFMSLEADVTVESSIDQAVTRFVERFGSLNVLVNCAGIESAESVLGWKGPASLDNLLQLFQCNVVGTFNCIRFGAMRMAHAPEGEDGERGVIVNTSSIAAFDGQKGQAAYAASKAAVAGLTLPLARELGDYGIRVVAIAPGVFETPMAEHLRSSTRSGLSQQVVFPARFGKPSEFAAMVKHIVENVMINGVTLRLDGGLRLPR